MQLRPAPGEVPTALRELGRVDEIVHAAEASMVSHPVGHPGIRKSELPMAHLRDQPSTRTVRRRADGPGRGGG